MSPAEAAAALGTEIQERYQDIRSKAAAKTPQGAVLLKNAALQVLANPSPSAPGSPPGVRTGHLRRDWTMSSTAESIKIDSGASYAGYLEHGTRKMAARPFVDKITETALPNLISLFQDIGG